MGWDGKEMKGKERSGLLSSGGSFLRSSDLDVVAVYLCLYRLWKYLSVRNTTCQYQLSIIVTDSHEQIIFQNLT